MPLIVEFGKNSNIAFLLNLDLGERYFLIKVSNRKVSEFTPSVYMQIWATLYIVRALISR